MDLRIRTCTPDDSSFLAWALLTAGRGHVSRGIWEAVLDIPEEKCLQFLEKVTISEIPHLFHYSCCLIAETGDNIPAGSLGGYIPEKLGYHALQQTLPQIFQESGMDEQTCREINSRAEQILVCLPREIPHAWVIDSVATMPEYRGMGVAGSLIQAIIEEGGRQGCSRVQVNMYVGNEPALQLYRKLGFAIVEETRSSYFEQVIGSPGMMSLVRNI